MYPLRDRRCFLLRSRPRRSGYQDTYHYSKTVSPPRAQNRPRRGALAERWMARRSACPSEGTLIIDGVVGVVGGASFHHREHDADAGRDGSHV
jgi:hypothetical protein